ncbi:hypothetical protein ACU8L5_33195 (plasmid) [Rhizobium leguminosarum]
MTGTLVFHNVKETTMTICIDEVIELLRAELGNADPVERRQIAAALLRKMGSPACEPRPRSLTLSATEWPISAINEGCHIMTTDLSLMP